MRIGVSKKKPTNFKSQTKSPGQVSFKLIFWLGFGAGLIFAVLTLYYCFVFSESTGLTPVRKEPPKKGRQTYTSQYQISVSARVDEIIGGKVYVSESGEYYMTIFGNVPRGYVLFCEDMGIVSEGDEMPGDGIITRLDSPNARHIINVKY